MGRPPLGGGHALPAARPRRRLRLLPDLPRAGQGWWYFGCQRGGRISDLAPLLGGGTWGRELRGDAFRGARELVTAAVC
jgi:hypothetical protein